MKLEELPPPPISAEADLTDFAFMPLDVARLRRSRAWLICKRRPELAFYMLNLWTAAWHDRPAGSLEDDDDVLADRALCPPLTWPEIRDEALRGWVKCSDGRLYHMTVIEKVQEAWQAKLQHAYDRECGRLRKAAVRNKIVDFVPPTFDDWERNRVSAGQSAMSGGQIALSSGQPPYVQRTTPVCPPENALKGQGQGQGQGQGHTSGRVSAGQMHLSSGHPPDSFGQPQDQEWFEAQIQLVYPLCSGARKWFEALRACRHQVEHGEATWQALLDHTQEYRDFVAAGGVSGPERVMTPQTFFGVAEKIWKQERPLPKSKAERRLAGNLSAAEAFMRATEPSHEGE